MSSKNNQIIPTPDEYQYARELITFINESPSAFHAVDQVRARLAQNGYIELQENQEWALQVDQGYYVIRGGGSIIAFKTGTQSAVQAGVRLIGAHTDSPNLRLKPRLAKSAHNHVVFDIEPYGGVLLPTWTDRDLALAGQVLVRSDEGKIEARLVQTTHAICRIPNLAIHLNRKVNDEV